MPTRLRVFDTSIGTKLLVGVTGFLLFLYLILHIGGNVMVFLGPDTFNAYSHMLLSNPLVVPIEVGLLLIFLLHVYKTVAMTAANRRARPVAYVQKKYAGAPSRKTLASSTMIFSGVWLLVFIVIHVRTFKYGTEYETASGVRDLYRLEMENFSNPLTVGFYILSMLVVGSHLWHGASSSLQSLGIENRRWTPRILAAGKVAAVLIAAGFIVIAIWAFTQGARA
jgi:succinate dehydrogenase / fumarate reductase cytochrome b subunit